MDNHWLNSRRTGEGFVIWILAAAVFVFGDSRFFGGRGRSNDIFASSVKGGSFHIDIFAWNGSVIFLTDSS